MVGAPFALIAISVWCGLGAVGLWRCWGVVETQVALGGDFWLICVVGPAVSHLPLDNAPWILYGVRFGRVCWPVGRSRAMVLGPGFGAFCIVEA